jgi:hypothetical protein
VLRGEREPLDPTQEGESAELAIAEESQDSLNVILREPINE